MRMNRHLGSPGTGVAPERRLAPALRATLAVHAAGAAAIVAAPAWWPWIVGGLAANHLALGTAVLFPRAAVLGPNIVRLPHEAAARGEVSINFDDGPDPEVTPRVLDILDRWQAKASFFCIGTKAAAYPDLIREIVRRGHSVENHSHGHPHAFAFYGVAGLRREIDAAQKAIAAAAGSAPQFFRAPAGFRSPLLDPLLARRGLRYVSWTRRGYDTVSRDPDAVLARLVTGLAAGDILLLHDGCRRDVPGGGLLVTTVLSALLERLAKDGFRSVPLPVAFGHDSLS